MRHVKSWIQSKTGKNTKTLKLIVVIYTRALIYSGLFFTFSPMEIAALHEIFLNSTGVTTDTRKIAKDHLFFALNGEHFNGNEFAQQALEKGASYVVIDDEKFHSGDRTILVKNSLETLQELAKFHRQHL